MKAPESLQIHTALSWRVHSHIVI